MKPVQHCTCFIFVPASSCRTLRDGFIFALARHCGHSVIAVGPTNSPLSQATWGGLTIRLVHADIILWELCNIG